MNADYQWMDENYRARHGNGENERDMIDISLILKNFRSTAIIIYGFDIF